MSPGQKRRKAVEAAAEKGIPLGLVRVATLDGVRALLTYFGHTTHFLFLNIAVQSTALPTLTGTTLTHPTPITAGTPPLRLPPPHPSAPGSW